MLWPFSDPPEPLLTAILSASAADLLPLSSGLINLDLQLLRSVPIFGPPRLVLLYIKFNQAILNLGDQRAPFGCEHADPPRLGYSKFQHERG
jgi:hypothetical protein